MPKPRLLAAIVAVACCTPVHATEFSNAIFFGDSLSDSGSFIPVLPEGTGRFTTNPGPVWSEILGQSLGLTITPGNQGGTNFAEGGARVTGLPGVPDQPPTGTATPVRNQIDNYLAGRGGQADGGALHTVWVGANDIFTILPSASADPAGTQAFLETTTAELVGEIARLSASGARHIVVINLPDIGNTPFGASLGATGAAGVTQLSAGFNQLLGIGLAASGVPVLQLDAFSLLSEVSADPARYGFTNATATACGATPSLLCTSADLVAPGAEQDFVFADGVHPTTGAHALVAQYVDSVLAAPGEIAQLAETPVRTQVALARRLWRVADQALSTSAPGGNSAWASIEGGRTEIGDTDGTPWGLAVGMDRRISEQMVLGGALSFERSEPDWSAGGGFTAQDIALSGYVGWRSGALSLTGSLTLATTDYDTERRTRLGAASRTHEGDPEGSRVALGAQAAYAMRAGSVHHGPLASVLVQEVSVPGFSEKAADGSTSSNLGFDGQRRKSTLVSAGWQALLRAGAWTPYASVMLNHDTEGSGRKIGVSTSLSPQVVEIAVDEVEQSYASVSLGAVGRLGRSVQLSMDLNAVIGADELDDTRLSAALRIPF